MLTDLEACSSRKGRGSELVKPMYSLPQPQQMTCRPPKTPTHYFPSFPDELTGAKTGALFPLEEGAGGTRGISLPHTEPWPDRPRHCGAISHRVRIWVRRSRTGAQLGLCITRGHAALGATWVERASQQPPISIITRNRVVHHFSRQLSCLDTSALALLLNLGAEVLCFRCTYLT